MDGKAWQSSTQNKKGTKTVPGCTIDTNGDLFRKEHSFSLNYHVYEKKSTPCHT